MSPENMSNRREFAVAVVQRLRESGHQALWAGGCVRDELLGLEPKDYDVATDATPGRVREIFGVRRTIAVGAAFGVITVLGPKAAGNVEVATFRQDAQYSDGRHPDRVVFSTPECDAQRRDFTINGLFYDPIGESVIDYVGGREDLQKGLVRAIGVPEQRFAEDKLRMLRAIRFTTQFGFQLDPETLNAIRRQADDLVIVSAERVAEELRRMLLGDRRADSVRLLHESNLLPIVLPECERLWSDSELHSESDSSWQRCLRILDRLEQPTFAVALAALFRDVEREQPGSLELAGRRLRLANHDVAGAHWLVVNEMLLRQASRIPWPKLQRLLTAPRIGELLPYAHAVALVVDGATPEIDFCRDRLRLPVEELNPPPLINGHDLKRAGLVAGPRFREVLDAVRDAQLERQIATPEEALELAARFARLP